MVRLGLALSALVLVSCGKKDAGDSGTPPKPTEYACPPDSQVTWESFAKGYVDTWCTGCHSALVVGEDRNFAPDDINFDTYEQAVQWGDRIRRSAALDDYYMPPQGGVTTYDRALLREWIDCGMPGEPTPVVGCDAAVRVPGDMTLTAADMGPLCNEPAVILEGSVTVTEALAVDCLCEVEGDLEVWESLTASKLTRVGSLTMTGGAGLNLPELVEVMGSVDLTGTSLTSLSLPELATVQGDWVVASNASLQSVSVPRLATVNGELRIEDNDALTDLSQTLAISQVDGAVRVLGNDALIDLDAFRFAADVGGVEISGNALLQEIGGFELFAESTGDVAIESNPSLRRLGGWDSMVDLHGSLRVVDNPVLEAIIGLVNLASIDGDLTVTGNLGLPDADAQFFAAPIAVGGSTDVSGNGP